MNQPVKIASFELENVKRIKLVELEPTENGLTVIGGRNNQGKTSVLDSLAWALGGNKFKPTKEKRDGSTLPPNLKVTLSNGIVVERKGKNSALKVTDPTGQKSGQKLLDSFIEPLALNLPKFMESTSKDKADTLLNIIGVGPQLAKLNQMHNTLWTERTTKWQLYSARKGVVDSMPSYDNVPADLISISDLLKQQQDILAKNGENARKRANLEQYKRELENIHQNIVTLQKQLNELFGKQGKLLDDIEIAEKDVLELHDESTEELEENIRNIESINAKITANLNREKAIEEQKQYKAEYDEYTVKIRKVEQDKVDLLKNANLPLQELSVNDEGEIVYKNQPWDNMSGSDQLKVATAIVRKLNPDCGFVFMDKLEQMDIQTMQEFGAWLEQEGLQVIATRVSTGDECSIIIEDGTIKEDRTSQQAAQPIAQPILQSATGTVDWKKGW